MKNVFALLAIVALLVGCASSNEVHERGWVGGTFSSVTAESSWTSAFGGQRAAVWGVPEGVDAGTGLLVESAHAATPLSHAGIELGDLVLAADGAALEESLDLREHVDGLAPGTPTVLTIWRDGEVLDVAVTVGKEFFQREGTLSLGLGLPLFGTSTLDVWPFDDGIDILGLVRAKSYPRRRNLASVRGDYATKVHGDPLSAIPAQERFDVRLVVIGLSRRTRVVGQAAYVE